MVRNIPGYGNVCQYQGGPIQFEMRGGQTMVPLVACVLNYLSPSVIYAGHDPF